MLVAAVGGVVGVGLTFLVVNMLVGPAMEMNMAGIFPYFRVPVWVLGTALAIAAALGGAAAAVPAWRASRLKVTDALRRLD
jgi:putative ABC transport system permease protein